MFGLLLAALLLLSSPVNTPEDLSQIPRKHPLEQTLGSERVEVAKEIELHLASHGFGERLIRAAVINAYAESDLNPAAVGDRGRSVGVFQLNSRGLGHNMTKSDRMDVKIATEKIAHAVYKDKTLIEMQARCESLEDMVKAFTLRIERPSHAKKKAAERAKLIETLGVGLNAHCTSDV
jgi:hypothetical protein